MKKLTAIFTALVMAIMTLSVCVSADTISTTQNSVIWDGSVDTSWYTGDKEVYDIGTASELAGLSKLVNSGKSMDGIVFNLTNDILLNDLSNWRDWVHEPPKNTFTPIGHSGDPIGGYFPFCGVFNGNGHTIRGLYVNSVHTAGLFGFLYCAGVTSVIIDKSVIIARDSKKENFAYAGAIAGISDGSVIAQCENRGYVYSLGEQENIYGMRIAYAGGIVGALKMENYAGLVGQLFVQTIAAATAGVIFNPMLFNDGHGGIIKESGVVNCINRGYVEACSSTEVYLGGIVGWGNNGIVSNCLSSGGYCTRKGKMNATHLYGARLCGGVFNCGVKNCYYLKKSNEPDVALKQISPVTPVIIDTIPITAEQLSSQLLVEKLGNAFVYNEGEEISLACDLHLPFDDSWDLKQTPEPVISPNGGSFSKSQTIEITCPTKYTNIYYTLDGTEPTTKSKLYEKPFTITDSKTVKAIAYKPGCKLSSVVTATFTKGAVENPPSSNTDVWKEIIQDLEKSTEKEHGFNLNGVTEIPADVINSISKTKKRVEFAIDNYYSWLIDGARVSVPDKADLTFTITTTQNPKNLRGSITTQFKINNTGVPSDLTFYYVSGNQGKFSNLYKLVNGKYAFVGNQKVAGDGYVELKNVKDKGEYVIMLSEFSDMPGDMNNDGFVNAKDAYSVLVHSMEIENGVNPEVCDLNNDGFINAKDAFEILMLSLA